MQNNEEMEALSALDLMLRWNRYCDKAGREGDFILLSEPLTYQDLNNGDEQMTLKEILNSDSPDFSKHNGFLVSVYYDDGSYRGMLWVSEDDIGRYVDLYMLRG